MKKALRSFSRLIPVATAIALAMASQFPSNLAYAGSGWGYGNYVVNPALPVPVQTYYANSPAGPVTALDPVTGLPSIDSVTNLPVTVDTGKALRKFVDTLPGFGSGNANNLGQYIPVAVAEKNWVNPATGVATADDYYEIAAIEYSEKMHSDLPKATHLRGYVQLMTPGLAAKGLVGKDFTTFDGRVLSVVDNPHHLGPVIQAASGTAVRVKFTNYLPVGGNLFLPVDKSITGAGLGPDGATYYTENRTEIHLVGGQAPWISAGSPHQWVAPAGETAAHAAGLGKGASAQNVPDMADPGAGSTTLYFPNTQSARFMFYQDRTSGLTRLNSYAGLEAGYLITDPVEDNLVQKGIIPADQIPLIIEDKTFVPANIAQQDAKWDTNYWGQPGDLWFPHVYETNQDPNAVNSTNPVGRWDYGPWFWPIFPATQPLPTGVYGDASFTPEAYQDTPVINGTAYPTLTVDPKAYRFRILNASNDRYINLGWYKADSTLKAPMLDRNGNPTFDASGNQLYFTNTEVKTVPAIADVTGTPLVPTYPADPLVASRGYDCLCQYPQLPQLQPAIQFSGPNRAWPIDARAGGAPDPTAVGPDFIAIGSDGGLLPNPVDIPSQPVTYESNRRSVTVGNIYGYGLLLGPAERSDAIVDFSAYAGQTLILYNDAPAPAPFIDSRVDYYTSDPDQTGTGGTYSTKPGYGPNTRTMMQIKVNNTTPAAAYDPTKLLTALPAAYAASQPAPIVPESAYNAAFNTKDSDNYAHVATGSVAQPNLDFTATPVSGSVNVTGVNLISSGGQVVVGTANIVGNPIPGSGTGYTSSPTVSFVLPPNATCATPPAATAVVDNTSSAVAATANHRAIPAGHQPTYQVIDVNVTPGAACTAIPQVIFSGGGGVGAQGTVVATTAAGTTISQSILVQTKAEQELFDTSGRYNSTGGVELPLTSGNTQTTIPLNYIDSTTEIIGDNEVQIWKIVDNGFWSNSIHFDFVDVQLINRVGWDGTLKPPASNEVGWKDTVRLNPLEDVIIAMRAKRPSVPFGQPASSRLQDPSKPAGAAGSGLGFTTDPAVISPAGVAMLTTTTNVTANYDNEYVWNSAILGHSEDDFMRPVVYHPLVVAPSAPVITAGLGGALTWTDPTPAGDAATPGNPANEIGFKVLRAAYRANGTLNAYAPIGTAPANATSYKDTTQVAGTDYSYQVQAWNTQGAATSNSWVELTTPATPTWTATAVTINPANGAVTLQWNTVAGATGYIVTASGTALPVLAAAGGATQSTTVNTLVPGSAYSITVTAQKAKYGASVISPASTAVTADLTLPQAPAAPVMGATTITAAGRPTLTWAAVAGASGYLVSVNGGTPVAVAGSTTSAYTFPSAPNAGSLALGSSYDVTVAAQITKFGQVIPSTTPSLATIDLTPAAAPAAPASVQAALSGTTVTLTWPAVNGASQYPVQVSVNGGAFTALPTVTTTTTTATVAANNTYVYQVAAQSAKTVSSYTTTSAPSAFTQSNTVAVLAAPVLSVQAGSLTATGFTLSFAVNGATSYNVTVGGVTTSQTASALIVSGASGTSYGPYTVQACNNNGSACTAASNAVTQWTLPAAPAISSVSSVTTTGLTLGWTGVTGATGYALQYSTDGGGTWAAVGTGAGGVRTAAASLGASSSSAAIAGLAAGTSYSFQLRASDAAGAGAWSGSANQTTLAATPATPALSVQTSSVTATGFTLSFAVNGATSYNVTVGGVTTSQTASTLAVSGASGTSYGPFTITACSNNGTTCSAASNALTQWTLPAAPATPGVSGVTATGLTLGWTGVTGATGYALQYSTDGGLTWAAVGTGGGGVRTTAASLGAASASAAIAGLTAGTSYSFQLRASDAAGAGAWSGPASQTTLALTPATPALSVQAGSVTASGFTLTFAVAGATSYNVTVGGVTTSQTASTLAVSGAPGTSYGPYTVQACSNNGTTCSAASNAQTQWTLPAAPVISGVSNVTATGLTVNWGAVTGATGYTLQYSTNGGASWANAGTGTNGVRTTAASLGAGSTSAAILGLTGNTSYSFQLRATDVAGAGAYSAASAAQLTPPSTPAGVNAANGANGAPVTGGLNWNAPAGGATSYVVIWTGPSSGSATTISGAQLTFATPGTYSMTVTAVNATGSSAPSAAVNVTVR